MALRDSLHTDYLKGSYTADLKFLIKTAENQGLNLSVHTDSKNRPVIGYGYDLVVNRGDTAISDLTSVGVQLTAVQRYALRHITASTVDVPLGLGGLTLAGAHPNAADELLDLALAHRRPDFQKYIDKIGGLADSRERAVLESMWYQGQAKYLEEGNEITKALQEDNRAEVWYQIRYRSAASGRNGPGVVKRRYAESEYFGLYDHEGTPPSQEESLSIYRMFAKHRDTMLNYENRFGIRPDGSNGDRNLIALANSDYGFKDTDTVLSLKEELRDASKVILDAYIAQPGFGATSSFDPLNIQVASSGVPALIGENDTARTGCANDLLIGSDAGNEALIGNGGNDVLYGGKGDNDVMQGGAGNDIYAYGVGDGKDIVNDMEGINGIYLGRTQLTGSSDGFGYDDRKKTWSVNNGEHVYQFDPGLHTLVISGSALGGAGNSITLVHVDNLQQIKDQFGIALNDKRHVVITEDAPNPDNNPANSPSSDASASTSENGSKRINIALNSPLKAGDKVTVIQESGSVSYDQCSLVCGDDTLSFGSGSITLTPQAGQDFISFALLHEGELDADGSVSFQVILNTTDDYGNAVTVESNLFTLTVQDKTEEPGTVQPTDVYPRADESAPTNDADYIPDNWRDDNNTYDGYEDDRYARSPEGISGVNLSLDTLGGDDYVYMTYVGNTVVDLGDGDETVERRSRRQPRHDCERRAVMPISI